MRFGALTRSSLAAVAMVGLGWAASSAGAAAHSPLAMTAMQPAFPAPASQTVEIDGRFITVELTVIRAIGGAPIDPPPMSTTTVHVTLSVNDGALLPEGLDAVGVRFEKLRGVNRFFFTPLEPEVIAFDGFEHVQQGYQGDLSSRASVQFLRAVVRLELDGDVIKVPMGIVRVNTLLLP